MELELDKKTLLLIKFIIDISNADLLGFLMHVYIEKNV